MTSYQGIVRIVAPHSSTITTSSPSAYDLTFKLLPFHDPLSDEWYAVTTNNAGAGSGTVTITDADKECRFNIFYSQGWQAVNTTATACYTTVHDNLINLIFV